MNYTASGLVSTDDMGIITSFNPSAEKLFGYQSNEVIGKNVNLLAPDPYRSNHDSFISRYRKTNNSQVIGLRRETSARTKSGHIFPIDLAVNEMIIGDRRYFIADIRDISKDKAIEKNLLIAKEKAEIANRAKDSFLTTMSHEIRTPLSGMLGMLEVLSFSKLDKEQSNTLKAAWDSAKSLLRIVSDILDWSKIEEGKLSIVPRSTSVSQLIQEVIHTYSHVASSKNLSLIQYTDPKIGPAHLVDGLRLSQILNNFVSNAIKFTKHGKIEVRAELIEHLDSGDKIKFSVKDAGMGIPKQIQKHLFQRYKQENEDTTRLYGGTGLGLAICRRLADLMDAVITLESELGSGSTFSIIMVLPISGLPGETHSGVHPPELVFEKPVPLLQDVKEPPLILIVDDHPINRELLSRQINLFGLRSLTCTNGREALALWRQRQFSMVITDCHMPELDGYALSKAIREAELKLSQPSHIPIIGWTANAIGDEAGLCNTAGMDDLLLKPTNMANLRSMLIKWLNLPDSRKLVTESTVYGNKINNNEPIDIQSLEQTVPDQSLHPKILHDFLDHIRSDLIKLQGALDEHHLEEVEQTAHRMKGSCRMVGAKELAAECAAIEAAAHSKQLDKARLSKPRLDDLTNQIASFIIEAYKND